MKRLPEYLDNAATTPVDPRVKEAMLPYFDDIFGNASSNHIYGKQAKSAIEKARQQVSDLVGCESKELIFTSGATEAINLALKGYVDANAEQGNHIITVKTEHKAVLATCAYLEERGTEVTYLDVDENGLISLEDLEQHIRPETILISVMFVNNEIGVIQDMAGIGLIARANNICFFSDATQALGKIEIDLATQHIDMLCFSGHKLNGPKGIGALYVRRGIKLTPLIHGGGQESGMRGGTYNTPLIAGLGKACELAQVEFDENRSNLLKKRNDLIDYYESNSIGTVNFKDVPHAPHILSITLNDQDAEEYLMLQAKEFVASTGSACQSSIVEESHVLASLVEKKSKYIIRISL